MFKNLSAKMILLLGLPTSLVMNFCVAGASCSLYDLSNYEFWGIIAFVAVSIWSLLSVPLLVGMAIVRYRIDRSPKKPAQASAAISCCAYLVLAAILGLIGIYVSHGRIEVAYQVMEVASTLIGALALGLLILTLINSFLNRRPINEANPISESNFQEAIDDLFVPRTGVHYFTETTKDFVEQISLGVVFIHCFGSPASRQALTRFAEIVRGCDPDNVLDVRVIDTTSFHPLFKHSIFSDSGFGGWGEAIWVKDGKILSAALGRNAEEKFADLTQNLVLESEA